jgi:hypothetical protein
MKRRLIVTLGILSILVLALPAHAGNPDLEALAQKMNAKLGAAGLAVQVGNIELFTIGNGRPGDRILQSGERFVPNDPRRNALGTNLRYIVRQGLGTTSSGLTNGQTESAIDAALLTWGQDSCAGSAPLVKLPDPGVDLDIADELIGVGDSGSPPFGNLFRADIIETGFRPRALFDRLAPGGGDFIIAVTFSFFFNTDGNNDHYFDTAFAEVYYNDSFHWGIGAPLPSIDVQTVALHENGHALGIGHFGPPPTAVMNPFYGGVRLSPFPTDHAAMCAVWGPWPIR